MLLLSIVLFGYACAVNPVSGKKEISFMSESQELALGKQSDPSIVASFGLYDDQTLQNFINEKGMEMAKISHRPNLPYEFKILDSPVINAFAVPGGYVYFTRGILAHFNNEAEFAGVLGHEIGHVTARHSAKAYTKQMLGQIGFMGLIIASKEMREFAEPLSQGMQLMFLKNSRDHESESDKLGVEYSTEVGYDAHQMAEFFKTLKRKQEEAGASIPNFQSTHPDPGDRYNKVNAMAEEYQAETGGTFKVNRDKYLRLIDGLVFGEDPRQGYVEDDYFYHPTLKFKFPVPRNWQTANSPQQFQMADSQGKGMMVLLAGQETTTQAAAQAFNEKQQLKVLQQQQVTVNGMRAYRQVAEQVAEQQTQQAASLRILSYFIPYNGLMYGLHGIAKPADYANMERTFLYTMEGFNVLSDPAKINRMPDKIRVVTVDRTTTLSSFLQSKGMPSTKLNELSLVNGMNLTDQVTSGSLIKIIEYDQLNRGGFNTSRSSTTTPPPSTTTNPAPTTTKPADTKSTNTGHLPPPPRTNTNTGTQTPPATNTNTNTGTKKQLPGGIIKKKKNNGN